jgi:hypothetical protein
MVRKKPNKIVEITEKIKYHKESSVGDGVGHTPPRKRRRSTREQE